LKSLHSLLDADFSKKVCTKYAQSLHKVCMVCTCSAQILHINQKIVWDNLLVDNFADLMHTFCRIAQTYCRNDADYAISVQFKHFSVVIGQVCTTYILQTLCTLMQTEADTMQTLCRQSFTCATGALICCHQWQMLFLRTCFCRTYVASKGRIRAGCIPALRRVEKQEDQG